MKKNITIIAGLACSVILTGMLLNSNYQNNKKLGMLQEAIEVIQEQEAIITELNNKFNENYKNTLELEQRLSNLEKLDIILKDLASSWSKK